MNLNNPNAEIGDNGQSPLASAQCSTAPFRMTLVIEYENADKCPAVGKEQCRGGTIIAAAFYDALEKLETLESKLR